MGRYDRAHAVFCVKRGAYPRKHRKKGQILRIRGDFTKLMLGDEALTLVLAPRLGLALDPPCVFPANIKIGRLRFAVSAFHSCSRAGQAEPVQVRGFSGLVGGRPTCE